jgi:predicted  nucleic acid-binding Zn-ribbon protein
MNNTTGNEDRTIADAQQAVEGVISELLNIIERLDDALTDAKGQISSLEADLAEAREDAAGLRSQLS